MNINSLNTFKLSISSKLKFPEQLPVPCMSSCNSTSWYLYYGFCFILKLSLSRSQFVIGVDGGAVCTISRVQEQAAMYSFLCLTKSVVSITHENKLLYLGTFGRPSAITVNDGNGVYL
jgi:hypothetical protein